MTIDRLGIVDFALRHFEENRKRNTRWNGRQIRNAFQTATALAVHEAAAAQKWPATLEVGHFETVAEASLQFDMYIAETIGVDAAQRALLERIRADNFKWAARNRNDLSLSGPPHDPYQNAAPNTNINFSQSQYSQPQAFGYEHNPLLSNFTQDEGIPSTACRHEVVSLRALSAPNEDTDYDYGNNP